MYSLHTLDEKLREIRDILKNLNISGTFQGSVSIVRDEVGLARDTTLQEVGQLLEQISAQLTTSTASILAQLQTGVLVSGSVTIAGQPISVSPSTTFPVSGSVGIVADTVGLARDSTLAQVRDRLPSSLTTAGNLRVAILEDLAGLAKDATLNNILAQLQAGVLVSGTVSIAGQPISVLPSGTFPISGTVGIVADNVGLARDSTVAQIRDRLPTSLTTAGNLKVAVLEDLAGLAKDATLQSILTQLRTGVLVSGAVSIAGQPLQVTGSVGIVADFVGLARDTTLAQVRDRLPTSLTASGNFKVAILEDSVGLARDSTLNNVLTQLRTGVLVSGSVSIAGQPIQVTGSVGIVADSVGLARDTTLQGIKAQTDKLQFDANNFLRIALANSEIMIPVDIQGQVNALYVTGTVGIIADTVGLARDTTLAQVRDRLPSSLTTAGNLKVAILEDSVGLARDSTLNSVLTQLRTGVLVSGTVSIAGQPVQVTGSIGIVADTIGLARDSTVAQVRDRLPSSLTSRGNFKVAILEDSVGLARDSTLNSVLTQLRTGVLVSGTVSIAGQPISVKASASFPISGVIGIISDSVGLARDNIRQRIWGVDPGRTDQYDYYWSGTYTVTATTWTTYASYNFYPRYWPVKTYAYYVRAGIGGYVNMSGATLYVRIRDSRTGATSQASITATGTVWVYPSMTVYGVFNEVDTIYLDAYVTTGTGYIKGWWVYIHPIDTVWALKSWNTSGFGAVPLFATSNNNLKIAVAEDTVGLARDATVAQVRDRLPASLTAAGNLKVAVVEDSVGLAKDSTVSSLKLVGGTLNASAKTLATNTATLLVGSNANRITVAVMNDSTGVLYIGPSSSALSWAVYPGQAITLNYTGVTAPVTTISGASSCV